MIVIYSIYCYRGAETTTKHQHSTVNCQGKSYRSQNNGRSCGSEPHPVQSSVRVLLCLSVPVPSVPVLISSIVVPYPTRTYGGGRPVAGRAATCLCLEGPGPGGATTTGGPARASASRWRPSRYAGHRRTTRRFRPVYHWHSAMNAAQPHLSHA